jgi:hypothetical protein
MSVRNKVPCLQLPLGSIPFDCRHTDSPRETTHMMAGRKRSEPEEDEDEPNDSDDSRSPPRKVSRTSVASDLNASSHGDGDGDGAFSEGRGLIRMPKYRDILLGRGRGIQSSNGNYLMREIARKHRDKYTSLRRDHRRAYSEAVLDEIYESGARFLKKVDTSEGEMWEEVDRAVAHDKVSHALRDRPPENTSRRPGVPVGTNDPPNSQMFQDPASGKMYHIANGANLTSGTQSAGLTAGQSAAGLTAGQCQPPPGAAASALPVTAAPAAGVTHPALGGLGFQSQILQYLMTPYSLQTTGLGLPGFGTQQHTSAGFGNLGGGGTLPAGTPSVQNLPLLLNSLASLVQQTPSLGGLIQQVLSPSMVQHQQHDIHGNSLVAQQVISTNIPAASASSNFINNIRNIVPPNPLWSAAQTGVPSDATFMNPFSQRQQPQGQFGATESRQEPSALDHLDIRLGVSIPDMAQSSQHQNLVGNAQTISNASHAVQGLQGTDYAYAVMQALMAVRPPADSSTGSAPHNPNQS